MHLVFKSRLSIHCLFALLLYTVACDEEDARKEFVLRSGAFGEDEALPSKYTCSGVSPPLTFSKVPQEVKSLVVILEDPDRISGTYTQWMIWSLPRRVVLPADIKNNPVEGAVMGTADDGKTVGYVGVCPPGKETHRAAFTALGLDTMLTLEEGADRTALNNAMDGHIIAEAKLTGKAIGQ